MPSTAATQIDLFGVETTTDLREVPPDRPRKKAPRGSWSRATALDPKHRPQTPDRPSSTVRREWCRSPQEAHLLDVENRRYRRLTPDEIAVLQGFDPEWFPSDSLSDWQRVQAIGDSVPPPLATAVFRGVSDVWDWSDRSAIEICAGAGGLASAVAGLDGFSHRALIERWKPACEILRSQEEWSRQVCEGDVLDFDFAGFSGQLGLLSGGPPCQPWSQGGEHGGFDDTRDLLQHIPEIVGTVEPEVFVFENVPGLASKTNQPYLRSVMEALRQPGPRTRYGVMAGILNAADFGVPQLRRRLFLIGFRDSPTSLAHQAFDAISRNATHRDPGKADASRDPWRTVGEALSGRPDPGGWRSWID